MTERMEEARTFLAKLASNPPTLNCDPELLPELFAKTSSNNNASASDIAEVIGRSQGLAAKVLHVANSAAYGLESTIASLERAVIVLGMVEVRSLAVLFAVSGTFPASRLPKGFPGLALWKHQILTAQIARCFARHINTGQLREKNADAGEQLDPEALFAAGLLHDVGKLLLGMLRPRDWVSVTALSAENKISFSEAEDKYWGLDHGTVGGMVLSRWNLPEILVETVSWHHYPLLASRHKDSVAVMAAANLLADQGLDRNGRIPAETLELLPGKPDMTEAMEQLEKIFANQKAGFLAELL